MLAKDIEKRFDIDNTGFVKSDLFSSSRFDGVERINL